MRIMALTALLQFLSPTPPVVINLPTAYLTAADIGGTVLMINMKHSLVVSKKSQDKLIAEIGEQAKAQLFKDIVMGTDVLTIEKKYASYQSGELSELMIKYSSLNQLTP